MAGNKEKLKQRNGAFTFYSTVAALTLSILVWSCNDQGGGQQSGKVTPYTYLTWRQADTATTITVNVHSDTTVKTLRVLFDADSAGGDLSKYRYSVDTTTRAISGVSRLIHSADLTGLFPNSVHYFTIINPETNAVVVSEKSFKTLPDDNTPLRLAVGGDMDVGSDVVTFNRLAASKSPQVALLGGDIAYDDGVLGNYTKWDTWLKYYTENMITPEGHLIPLIMAIGNHEVSGGYNGGLNKAPFWTNYFAQEPGKSYFSRKLNQDTVLFVLDSGHAVSHGGAQADWLTSEMQAHQSTKNRLAIYHVPLFPSVRSFSDANSSNGRKNWLSIFDNFGLTVAFENHDHALKRTKMLKGGKPTTDGSGTLYLGDGCWGTGPRGVSSGRDYIAHSEGSRHFWDVKISPSGMSFDALGSKGEVLDQTSLP